MVAPLVQVLGVPVPQMADQLPVIEQFFRAVSPDPEQVIEVPKILPCDVPMRTAVRDSQLAEQLVEVPTIVSSSSLQRTVEQHVDIPVPGGGGPSSGLQGISSGQRSTATPSSQKRRVRGYPPVSSTPAAQLEVAPVPDSIEWVQLSVGDTGKAYCWNRRTRATRWTSGRLGWDDGRGGGSSITGTGIRVSVHTTFLLCLPSEAHRVRGLASHHPFSGAFWQSCSVSSCCPNVQFWILLGFFRIVRLLGSTADTVHVSVWWRLVSFHTYPCEGVRRIQRAILGQTYRFSTSSLLWKSLVRCLPREGYRKLWIYREMTSGMLRFTGMLRSWQPLVWCYDNARFSGRISRVISAFSPCWLYSGYIYGVSRRVFGISNTLAGAENCL